MKEFLSAIHSISESVLAEYISDWAEYEVPRKTVMTAPGETEGYIYFVTEGIQKSYFLSERKQHVMAFAYAPSFSGILESFFTQTPSKYYLETITDSRFRRMSYTQHLGWLEKHREIEVLFRKATGQFMMGLLQRQHELMAFDMKERFRAFVGRSPHLLGMIPQKDLASYLRIDATNFSKLINSERI